MQDQDFASILLLMPGQFQERCLVCRRSRTCKTVAFCVELIHGAFDEIICHEDQRGRGHG
jgi:hypothetical protein